MYPCSCNWNCVSLSVIGSIVLGVIATFLRLTAAITVTPVFLWVLFGIAVVYLAVSLLSSALAGAIGEKPCVCSPLSANLIGALGTILFSLVLLGVTLAATSLTGAILTGILVFFFFLLVSSTACLANCLTGCNRSSEN